MSSSSRGIAAIPAILGILVPAGAFGLESPSPSGGAPCANFGQVSAGLYRGAEPDDRCLEHLAGLGIRMVVNLRDEKDASEREAKKASALGMRYVNLPMSGFGRPEEPEVRRVLSLLLEPEGQPVFVHCRRGRDRTGVVVAAYRMAHEGWAPDRAVDEARRFGLAWWQVRMKRFIEQFEPSGDRRIERRGNP